ncbi:sensor histidine kinase [Actinomycetospora cinnamomea]|uniref:sensor histidine kinase n=1 Tax=Actinomycetospora cinnamomea TaxID=663609 RepID=UPI001FAFA80E|nr:histidine kinase [Actinomycetospora cinnamomea]
MDRTESPRCRGWLAATGTTVVLAVLSTLTVLGRADAIWPTGTLAVDAGVVLLSCALVPVVLRWPVPGALAMAALATISPAGTPGATFAVLRVAALRPLPMAVGIGAVGIVAHAAQGLLRPVPDLPYAWLVVIVVAAHAALVAWGALARQRSAVREERVRRAEEEQAERVAAARGHERALIAREMHDVLAHRLSLVATAAGALEYRPDAAPQQVARAAGIVRAGAHQALEELREVIGVLRADTDGDAPPQPTLSQLPLLVDESRDAGVDVHLDDRTRDHAPETLARTAYRVVQEGLTNARRHAPGLPVRVVLDGAPGDGLRVEVRNPVPLAAPASDQRGTGLVGLRERAASLGGRLEHGETREGDFCLAAHLPWPT